MSWKSLVTAGLLCIVASPVFAAPDLGIVKGTTGAQAGTNGNLNTAGNWIWTVQVTPDLSVALIPDSSGTPVAAELGFNSTSTGVVAGQGNVLSATNASTGAGDKFDTINPGAVVFSSWQTAGNGLLDANSNNRPTGIQTQCPAGNCSNQSYTLPGGDSSVAGTPNNIFAALGSINFTTAGAKDYINVVVQRPVVSAGNPNTSTTIQVTGVYGTGGTNGRLTQVTGLTGTTYTTSNFDTFGGTSYSFTRNARGGDTNLDGIIEGADYNNLLNNWQGTPRTWYQGDFDGNGLVEGNDFNILLNQWQSTYTVGPVTPAAGSGLESGSVPEPASVALIGLALLAGLGLVRKR
jgi:hypothetical protein